MTKFIFYAVAGWLGFQVIKLCSYVGHLIKNGQCLAVDWGFICELSTLPRMLLSCAFIAVFAVLVALADFWLFRRVK